MLSKINTAPIDYENIKILFPEKNAFTLQTLVHILVHVKDF
jgi:hypothetical protein